MLATVIALLVAALLLAGIFAVPYRAAQPPTGYEQPRMHLNTKNTTRFSGEGLPETASRVAQAVYPATQEANTPDLVILYEPDDWQGGLTAASTLRPLNAVLLPRAVESEFIEALRPRGSDQLDGAQVLLINDAEEPAGDQVVQRLTSDELIDLRMRVGEQPRHAIIVAADEPTTALLAAPWAAYSGDLILFDDMEMPVELPRYALGDVEADDVVTIDADSAAALSVEFARYEDPENQFFGWGFASGNTVTGYRNFTIASPDDPATALQSANLAVRGKIGPLLWGGERTLPQIVNNYLWSQRPAFWSVPNEGPFDHVFILGDEQEISFPAQSQADYALEIGAYRLKGPGLAGMDLLASLWVALGIASALWIMVHQAKFMPQVNWLMRLAWPLLAMMLGPFGIPIYVMAYKRPALRHGEMTMWDRPLWLQGLVSTASSVGFGGSLMVATGFVLWYVGVPLFPNELPSLLFLLGTPMILLMIANYVVAVLISWPLFQTPMISMFHGLSYREALPRALPAVLASMASVSLAMFPGMWWLMMMRVQMTPTEESILWFGIMFYTVFLGFLISWPFNYLFVRKQLKSGMM